MGTTFFTAEVTATPVELVEKYGMAPFGLWQVSTDEDSVHVGIGNIGRIASVLAIGPDEYGVYSGEMDADAFLGRVLIALAVEPADAGSDMRRLRADEQSPVLRALVGNGGAPVYGGQRSAGYTQMRLNELRELAEMAIRNDQMIGWC